MPEIRTCPDCGALVVPQLVRCRQCKTYLHGTALEGLFMDLLPDSIAQHPGTGLLTIAIVIVYACMAVATRSPVGFSAFSLRQLGALHGPDMLQGQYFRLVSYMFGHHDLVHLAFNVSALVSAGAIVETLFDRKKMLLIYLAAGVAGGVGSVAYYIYLKGGANAFFVSAGASGAVSGLIGAGWIGARRAGYRDLEERMKRWALSMVFFGFMMSGINNAAHFAGFGVAVTLAFLTPLGDAKTPTTQRLLSWAAFAALGVIALSAVFVVRDVRGYPLALAHDAETRTILTVPYYVGAPREDSDQARIWHECVNYEFVEDRSIDRRHACELNVRVHPMARLSYLRLADLVEADGDDERARTLRAIARRAPAAGE